METIEIGDEGRWYGIELVVGEVKNALSVFQCLVRIKK